MQQFLNGQVCLVTGASRGIGEAIALALAGRGARIAVHCGSARDRAAAVARRLPGDGHLVLQADLRDPAASPVLVQQVMERAGALDVLVNNAGVFLSHPPLSVDSGAWLEAWQQTLTVNLLAPACLAHAAAGVMARRGGGRIVNIGSRGAFRGEPECPAYAASKAGLHAMSQSLALALGPHKVLVYAVAPGFVQTDMAAEWLEGPGGDAIRAQSPLGRVARPDEVAETVCFLLSPAAEFLTGGIVDVNGASYLRT